MKKIKLTIKEKVLIINYKIEDNVFKNIDNTNIITKDDLIFDARYFNNNMKLIAGFLNVIIQTDEVEYAIVEDEDLILTTFELLNYIPKIKELVIRPDIPIDYDIHMAILKNDTLKLINCYSIPSYLLERIDTTKLVKIETRAEVFFVSNFLKKNDLSSYSDIFYKKKLEIDYNFGEMDYKDFDQFLDINAHLKVLYFDYINMDLVKTIIKYLRVHKRKNIIINIKGNDENLKYFNELENFTKKSKYIKKNHIKFKIDYTREYKFDNFLRLLNFTSMKYILIVIILSCIAGYGINEYNIYMSSREVDSISNNINEILEEFEHFEEVPIEDPANSENPTTPNAPARPTYVSPYYKNYAKVISILKETNPDTVGWLTVNNTTVNYPVVQAPNNSYYLNHDFNKNSNSLGWIFMDYRNNPSELDQNTVIYGHNLAKDKIMFGNLSATMNVKWYTNPSNQYITFNTASGDMRWRIFSIYKIPATNDYLYNTFETQNDFLAFVDKLKSRSIYDFGVTVKENDKIVTLSTCQNSGKNRLVIHAVLEQ